MTQFPVVQWLKQQAKPNTTRHDTPLRARAHKQGWLLMGMCLQTFPPSDDFVNYLELFLKEKGKSNNFVGMLHDTQYTAQKSEVRSPRFSSSSSLCSASVEVAKQMHHAHTAHTTRALISRRRTWICCCRRSITRTTRGSCWTWSPTSAPSWSRPTSTAGVSDHHISCI